MSLAQAPSQPSTVPAPDGMAHSMPTVDPLRIVPAPLVLRLLQDHATDPARKRRLAIFHGQWDTLTNPTPAEQASMALARFDLDNPILKQVQLPVLAQAQLALQRGEPEQVMKLLQGDDSFQSLLLQAQACQDMGRIEDALALLAPFQERLRQKTITDPAELTAAAQGLAFSAGYLGWAKPSDYQMVMDLLGKSQQELDRLYWPALVAQGRLLVEKDNAAQGAKALLEALALNPKAGEAWYLLGRLALQGYDFVKAGRCVAELRSIQRDHPLADMLEIHLLPTQRDTSAAQALLTPALQRFAHQRELLALQMAAAALRYDEQGLASASAAYERVATGNPLAPLLVGQFLSAAHQRSEAQVMLRKAIDLQPQWPQPRLELGLLLMAAGEEDQARLELREATRLDPFNVRATNQLKLLDELATYAQIRTPHFVIKFRPGIDEALARDMPDELERIYRDITGVFQYKPERPTLIEIMPDEQWFGVRMTGLPWIWTIGASTGDVIALTPPREGPLQRGNYDWARVLRHEFVHTVTLNQTRYRIPHWFTEACAVSQEPGGRDYNFCVILAQALEAGKLFDLEQINWAFVRPQSPMDRQLAYAQADWMLEYITQSFGHQSVLKLLELYRQGLTDVEAFTQATGQNPQDFLAGFKKWGRHEVRRWGLDANADDARVHKVMEAGEQASTDDLAQALDAFPEHPDLLRLLAQRALAGPDAQAARVAIRRYAAARPVDPWPYRALVSLAARGGSSEETISALEELDRQEQTTGAWADQLSQVYRGQGKLDQAGHFIARALDREPYNATYREYAAAIDLQRQDLAAALEQVQALTILEPQRAVHFVRLAALHDKLGQSEPAKAAARQARQIDPKSPVERYLDAP